jgi:nucleoside-diphosphate-sugar epimerase
MARILVSGATGFLGKHLVERLQREGHIVYGTTLHSPIADTVLHCDIQNQNSVDEVFEKIDPEIVIHCAAISSVTAAEAGDYYFVNTVGAENIVKAVASRENRIRYIFISTAGVYGNQDTDYLHEELCPKPVHHYGMSKYCAERLLFNYANKIDYTIIRPFNIIGVGQSHDFLMPKLADAFSRRLDVLKLGNLDVFRDYIDVSDASEMIARLTFNPAAIGQVCNLCSGRPVSLQMLLDVFANLTSHKIKIEIDPALVRKNEVWRLLGDATKLKSLTGGVMEISDVEQSLQRMLDVKTKL